MTLLQQIQQLAASARAYPPCATEKRYPVALLDSLGQVLYANRACRQWLGASMEDLIHRPYETVWPWLQAPVGDLFLAPHRADALLCTAPDASGVQCRARRLPAASPDLFEIMLSFQLPETPPDTPLPDGENPWHALEGLPWAMAVVADEAPYGLLWQNRQAAASLGAGSLAGLMALPAQRPAQLSVSAPGGHAWQALAAWSPARWQGQAARLCCLYDATAEQQYWKAWTEAQLLAQRLCELAKVGYWRYSAKQKRFHWSESVYGLLGLSPAEKAPSAQALAERIHPDDLQAFYQHLEEALGQQKPFECRIRMVAGDRMLCLLTQGAWEYDPETGDAWVGGVMQDVSEQWRLESEAKRMERRYSMAHKIAKIGLWDWEIAQDRLSWSAEFADICGLSPLKEGETAVLSKFIAIIYPSERAKAERTIRACGHAGQATRMFHCAVLLNGGQKRMLLVQCHVASTLPNGKPERLMGVVHDVTEAKEAEQELRYHEYLSQNVTDAIISTNIQLRIKTWNKAAENMYGWKASEVIGKRLKDVLFSAGVNPKIFDSLSSELMRSGTWKGQLRQETKWGDALVTQSSTHLLKDHEGYLAGLVMVNRDMTDFARIEQEAFQNQQMLDLVFESMPGHVYWVDSDMRMLGCNSKFAEMIGLRGLPTEWQGIGLQDFRTDDSYKTAAMSHIREVLAHGHPVSAPPVRVELRGETRWLSVEYTPIRDVSGNIMGVLSNGSDMTAQLLAQQQLEAQQANLTAMVEHAGYALCYIGQDFRLKAYNASFAQLHRRLFGTPMRQEKAYPDQLPEAWRRQVEEVFHYVLLGNRLSSERQLPAEGALRWFELSCNPVLRRQDTIGLFFSVRDITQRKEQEKIQLRNQLRQEKARSLAVIQGQEEERRRVSMELHDGVGQLLTALQLQSNFLQGKKFEAAQELEMPLQKLAELVQQAKQEVRRISFNLMPSMLSDFGLGPSVGQLCESLFGEAGMDWHAEVLLEEERYEQHIEVGLFRVAQEVFNNAIKHSGATEVWLKLWEAGGALHFSFSDNGVGMEPGQVALGKQRGNGLNNIYQRMSLLNGTVSLRTSPGQGMQYALHIPVPRGNGEVGLE